MSRRNVGQVIKAHDAMMTGNSKPLNGTHPHAPPQYNRGHSTHGVPPKIAAQDLLRSSAPKKHQDVNYAGHVTPQQIAAAKNGGLGHATAAILDGGQVLQTSAAAAPLQHAYGGQVDKGHDRPVATTWGHRDRTSDHPATGKQSFSAKTMTPAERHALGRAILSASVKSGGRC